MWAYLFVAVNFAAQLASLPPAAIPSAQSIAQPPAAATPKVADHLPSLEPIRPRLLPPRKGPLTGPPPPADPSGRQRSATGFLD